MSHRPATYVIGASTVAILGSDLVLVATGNDSISTVVGEHFVLVTICMTFLWFHFTGRPRWLAKLVGRYDPLGRFVNWFARKR